MKNRIILLLTGLSLCLGACDDNEFLNRFPQDQPNPQNFFIDAQSARMAVNACSSPWTSNINMIKRDMVIFLDAMSDDSYRRPATAYAISLVDWNINPTHQIVTNWWTFPYQSINNANFAIDNIPTSSDPNFTPAQQAPYIAEAKFYRAFSYIFLTTFYGDVPLYTDAAADFSEFSKPRAPKADVLNQVVEDLTYAKENLPVDQPSAKGAPTKATAAAFLAKAHLYRKDWVKAEAAAREAVQIAESSGYKLQDNYLSIWSQEGNKELLFYWGFKENADATGQNFTVQRLCRNLPSTLRTAINGDGLGYAIPQRDLFDEYEPGDPRREYSIYYPGSDYEIYPGPADFNYTHEKYNDAGVKETWNVTYKAGDMVKYDYRWSESGMNTRKMVKQIKNIVQPEWDGLDCPVMRMAELYLILAEALAEQGKAEALTWVNKVRSRPSVNIPGRALNDGRKGDNSLVNIVRHERRVELAMEGLRLFDLIRWGTIGQVFGDGKKVKRHFFSDFLPVSSSVKYASPVGNLSLDPIFPIPQTEIDANSEINTNSPGW